jgi:hypothetical protein
MCKHVCAWLLSFKYDCTIGPSLLTVYQSKCAIRQCVHTEGNVTIWLNVFNVFGTLYRNSVSYIVKNKQFCISTFYFNVHVLLIIHNRYKKFRKVHDFMNISIFVSYL